ncbi:MAG: hypothetical protein EWM47_02210 [Anaerolineaceae bacterium]|nr:MAG: hypothetical protein EWM47_02210 [Anaerolineaceae bacterium]
MKNHPGKKAVIIMLMVLILTPILWLQDETVAYAATPTFTETKVEIIGEDETYQLDIKDKVAGSTYKWSSSNTKVARVSSKGLVTTVGKGSANIRCIITYPNKKTKTLTSKVTVIIPATKVKINNATEVNGAHIINVGDTYNFNRDIFPAGSSDKTYWSLGGGDKSSIVITNSSSGIIRADKPGKVILVATAARTATEADAAKSIVNDAIIIEVVGLSATVGSVDIVGSTEIKAVFDSPIDERTVIGQNSVLLDNIGISPKKNIKGVYAADPGKLTARLSDDKKTLIITSSNRFEGEYGINFTNSIKTTGGISIDEYYKQISYVDDVPPEYVGTRLDETGMTINILFNEAIDFSGLKVAGGGRVAGLYNAPADPMTVSILNNKNNYMPSEDKKSLTINLSNIAYTDFLKSLTVTLSGIKDMSGNAPKNYTIPIIFTVDNTPKPMAKLLTVERTAYSTLTATFDRSIEFGGYATIGNGSSMIGIVDDKDLKKVHFTMYDVDALKTGTQTVTLTSWRSINADPKDTSSYQQHKRTVRFDVEKSNPILLTDEFDPETNILTLTYNRDVSLSSNTGIFNATLVTVSGERWPNNNITYTNLVSENPKVVKLQMGNMTLLGSYTFTLDQNFARDSFRNNALPRTITINNSSGANLELPGPLIITQSSTNPSQIFLEFMDRLDEASAQDVRNYSIPGVTILSAKLEKNTNSQGAIVVLTIADGSITLTMERPVRINGVKSYSGTYAPITDFERMVELKDNAKPYYIGPPVYDKNKINEIRLSFSEEIMGSMIVRVTQMGTYNYEFTNTVTISGTNAVITLNGMPDKNAFLRIEVLDNKIVDLSGNQCAPMNTSLGVVAAY